MIRTNNEREREMRGTVPTTGTEGAFQTGAEHGCAEHGSLGCMVPLSETSIGHEGRVYVVREML